jgi:hypothetical protein
VGHCHDADDRWWRKQISFQLPEEPQVELTTGPWLDRRVVLEVDRVAARGQEVKLMTIWRILMTCATTIATSSTGTQAGPCYDEIYRMEAHLESLLQENVAAGPTAPESTEALRHHQPRRESIAAALSRLGVASPEAVDAVRRAMAHA